MFIFHEPEVAHSVSELLSKILDKFFLTEPRVHINRRRVCSVMC